MTHLGPALGESLSRPGVVPETPPFRSRSAQLHATGVTGAVGAGERCAMDDIDTIPLFWLEKTLFWGVDLQK